MKKPAIAAAAAVCVAIIPIPAWAQLTEADVAARLRANLDDNGDGVLSQAEYSGHFGSTSAFNTFDADVNAILDGTEFSRLIADGVDEVAYECDADYDGDFEGNELSCALPYID